MELSRSGAMLQGGGGHASQKETSAEGRCRDITTEMFNL